MRAMPRLMLLAVLAAGCAPETSSSPGDATRPPDHGPPDAGAATCQAPANLGSPATIQEAVDLLNALPEASVPCLIAALDRPLAVHATAGLISAQPAADAQNPRIFVFSDTLTLSIVPAGAGRDLLEFGEQRGESMSLKGELFMPAEQPVGPEMPYAHLRYNADLTACGICHRDERPVADGVHPDAYVSRQLRSLARERVGLDALRAAHAGCDAEADPARCAIYSAIFDHGPVIWRDFPDEMDTIYDR